MSRWRCHSRLGRSEYVKVRTKVLEKYNLDETQLATYARLAIEKIKHDVVQTFRFGEWKGDHFFNINPPQNAMT